MRHSFPGSGGRQNDSKNKNFARGLFILTRIGGVFRGKAASQSNGKDANKEDESHADPLGTPDPIRGVSVLVVDAEAEAKQRQQHQAAP